jgi:hypothetical protein
MLHDEQTMWIFEPHVAEAVFEDWVAEAKIPVVRDAWLDRAKGVKKQGTRIVSITTLDGKTYEGKQFMDTTYEGDLMAAAGVGYHVGREANAQYDEKWNGNQVGTLPKGHLFEKPVDPYKVPGDPKSGLVKYVDDSKPGVHGEADHRVQAYCFRMCLTSHPDNRVPFPKPEGYDPSDYELLVRLINTGWRNAFSIFSSIPNRKTDTNNHGAFGTDFIGMNYDYPEASYERRKEIVAEHTRYQLGRMYFLANDPRVPDEIRNKMSQWGLAKDEFLDNGHWPYQLYIREARRLVGEYVLTEHDCKLRRRCPNPIGMGSYTLDSHNVRRYVTAEGHVQNEGDIQEPSGGPYGIDYGAITPKRAECTNLLVPVCVSSSHIAFGSVRMEPVFMILGQSAATAAVFAIDDKVAVQEVNYDKLKERLIADGQRLAYDPNNAPERGVTVKSLPGIVQDNIHAKLVGEWGYSAVLQPFVGAHYLHDDNAGKGEKSVTFTIPLPEPGQYEVRFAYNPNGNRSKAVPVNIQHRDGATVVKVDQTAIPPIDKLFISLGTFTFGKEAVITVSNAGTTGHVIVDAVQLIKKP